MVLGRLGHTLGNARAAVVLQLGEAPISNNSANPLRTCRSNQKAFHSNKCWHDGRTTHLIERLRDRVVLVRRFSSGYRGKCTEEKLVLHHPRMEFLI